MHRHEETNGTRALCHGASSTGIASSFVPFHRIITNTMKNQSQLLPLPTFLISRCAFLSTETGLTLGVGFQILSSLSLRFRQLLLLAAMLLPLDVVVNWVR